MKYGDQVNFVGVAWTGDEGSFQEFVDEHGLTFPQLSDDPGDVFARFDVAFQPAFKIVGADGTVETVAGAVDETLLDQIVSETV